MANPLAHPKEYALGTMRDPISATRAESNRGEQLTVTSDLGLQERVQGIELRTSQHVFLGTIDLDALTENQ